MKTSLLFLATILIFLSSTFAQDVGTLSCFRFEFKTEKLCNDFLITYSSKEIQRKLSEGSYFKIEQNDTMHLITKCGKNTKNRVGSWYFVDKR